MSIAKLAGFFLAAFLIFGILNISRNAGYYEHNNQAFATAGESEILASPFQVAIGTAKNTDKLAVGLGPEYRDYVDVEIVLNTNSAFTSLLIETGYRSWPYIAILCFVMGFLFEALAALGKPCK